MAAATLANGRVIHYDDSGTGAADQEGQTPLVLLCGLGAPRSFWSETVTLLHEQRPHLRGRHRPGAHGATRGPRGEEGGGGHDVTLRGRPRFLRPRM